MREVPNEHREIPNENDDFCPPRLKHLARRLRNRHGIDFLVVSIERRSGVDTRVIEKGDPVVLSPFCSVLYSTEAL